MKTLKIIGKWILVTFVYAFLWGVSLQTSSFLLGIPLPENEGPGGLLEFLLVSSVNSGIVILLLHRYVKVSYWSRAFFAGSSTFIIQFFLSQIETWWFKSGVGLTDREILSFLIAGVILCTFFGMLLAKLFSPTQHPQAATSFHRKLLWPLGIAVVVVYPMLYFLAGYFIAFQSEELRLYYTGSAALPSFGTILNAGISDGLYVFQIIRGILWAALAWWMYSSLHGRVLIKATLIGLAFGLLLCSQLLIPNPAMPETIRWMHFIETASSTFLWGFLLTLGMEYFLSDKKKLVTLHSYFT